MAAVLVSCRVKRSWPGMSAPKESRQRPVSYTHLDVYKRQALVSAIDDYIAHHNTKPKPFIWTKSARDILQKVIRANSRLSAKQNATLH